VLVEWLNELNEGVSAVEVRESHRGCLKCLAAGDRQPEEVAEVAERVLGVGDSYGNVIKALKQRSPLIVGSAD
jgi:hypothetical protein